MDARDIVFVTPSARAGFRAMPLGIAYITSFLEKHGYSCEIIDIKKTFIYKENKKIKEKIFKEIKRFNPKFVGFTALTPEVPEVFEHAKKVREQLPDTKIIVGGTHATVRPQDFGDVADYIVIGEGEFTTLDLMKNRPLKDIPGLAWSNNGNLVINNPRELIEDLDSLPFPAYEKLNMEFYTRPYGGLIRGIIVSGIGIFTSRGCPYRCAYCSSRKVFGRVTRFRSPKNVLDEIEFLVNKYGIDGFYIQDDTFTVNEKHVTGICEELKNRGLDLIWGCETRVNLVNENILKTMREVGCVQIDFGVESGSPKILEVLKKDITVEQVKKAFELCHKYKIRTYCNIMINNPHETFDDIDKTREVAKEIKASKYDVWITTPYPGTELADMFGFNFSKEDLNKLVFVGEFLSGPIVKTEAFKDVNLGELRFKLSEEFKQYVTKDEFSTPIIKILKSRHKLGYMRAILNEKIFGIYERMPVKMQKIARSMYEKI